MLHSAAGRPERDAAATDDPPEEATGRADTHAPAKSRAMPNGASECIVGLADPNLFSLEDATASIGRLCLRDAGVEFRTAKLLNGTGQELRAADYRYGDNGQAAKKVFHGNSLIET